MTEAQYRRGLAAIEAQYWRDVERDRGRFISATDDYGHVWSRAYVHKQRRVNALHSCFHAATNIHTEDTTP
jgi:hypothetical protein